MSKAFIKNGNKDIFKTNRDKIICLILDEITFLSSCYNRIDKYKVKSSIKDALQELENLLKIHGKDSEELCQSDYCDNLEFIHDTINKVIQEF